MWLGREAFMIYDVLWKIAIGVIVFVFYASLSIAVLGIIAFCAVNKKQYKED